MIEIEGYGKFDETKIGTGYYRTTWKVLPVEGTEWPTDKKELSKLDDLIIQKLDAPNLGGALSGTRPWENARIYDIWID